MAWGVFTFTKDGRQRLAGVLRALLIAQLVVSLCMVIFCYNTSMKVLVLLKHIHKVTVYLLYGLILLQAYCMKLHYTSGLRLMSWFLRCPHWRRVMLASRVWMFSGSCVALNGMLVYAACRTTLKALMKELSSSLRIGIAQYLTEPTWKKLLDTMQIELGCCGADKPSDWHEIPWINMDFLNEKSDLVMKLAGSDGKVLPPVSPYSCCTPRVLAACYHDPLQQWREMWSGGSPLLSASLHTRGCVEAVRAPLTKALLALQLLSMLVVLLQIIIVILSQLLRTSARDAVLSGDCDGDGDACLIGHVTRTERMQPEPVAGPSGLGGAASVALALQRGAAGRGGAGRRRGLRAHTSYPYLS
ncbi:photoreceptor outer segment membrane glycoprotein 2-like [Pectinophora gossypiella]|uniref:photoreceptor outer segment membrane glycoprotein 2-like n=1 Tax=Pectinophora gossypiella TaxID=13191 RepID=UPI00214E0991|nr:photoreceptor outer segment membrane glycoprotein 2-like [Pectinophora gossypiella]